MEATLARRYKTVMCRPRPTAGKLRFLHRPDAKRSFMYPMTAAHYAQTGGGEMQLSLDSDASC